MPPYALRTSSLKVFHKSGTSVLISSFTLFYKSHSWSVFIQLPQSPYDSLLSYHLFQHFLSRSMTTCLCCSSQGITFTSLTFCCPSPSAQNQFLFCIHMHYRLFVFSFSFGTTCLPCTASFTFLFQFSPCTPSKPSNTFPYMPIEIPNAKDHFTRTLQMPFTCYFIIKTNFLWIWSSFLWPICIIIICITFFPQVSTIAITLSLFLLTFTIFLDIFSVA